MAVAGVTHHLVLNGVGYMLRQTSVGLAYRRTEVPIFTPRRVQSQVGRDALLRPGQDNGGFAEGLKVSYGEGGYGRSHGVDARAGDGLRIATRLDSVSLARQVNCWADFNGTVYVGTETGSASCVFKYSVGGNSFSELAGAGSGVRHLVPWANYLWRAYTTGGGLDTVGTISTADAIAAASGANCSLIRVIGRTGTKMVGLVGTGASRSVRWSSAGSDVGPTLSWTQANENGDPRETALNVASLGETAYVGKLDGLYSVSFDDSTPGVTLTRVVDHLALRDTTNFKALVALGGYLYYTIRDRLYRTSGGRPEDVTPPATVVGASGLGVTRYVVKALAAGSGWLWALTLSDESTPSIHLWAFNGERWEQLTSVVSAADAAVGSLHYSPNANRLFLNTYSGAAWATAKIEVASGSDLPASYFETTGNLVYLPPMDGQLPDLTKRWHSVAIRGSGISASQAVVVSYWNGASWSSLGTLTSDTGGELAFASTVTGKTLLLRLDLRSGGTATPIVREVGVTFDILAGAQKQVEMDLLLGPNLRLLDGTTEANSATTLLANLDACRAAGTVVALSDPVVSATAGSAVNVRVTNVEVLAQRSEPDASGQYGWVAKVTAEIV